MARHERRQSPGGLRTSRALALLAREGISTEGYFSKLWDGLPQTPDIVVTVCSNAAGETCPAWLGNVMRTHWGVDDPARATGSDAEIDAALSLLTRHYVRVLKLFWRCR